MSFYHSVQWDRLSVVLEQELIDPQPINEDDRSNNVLDFLADKKVNVTWFTSNQYIENMFGQYQFCYDDKLVVSPSIVKIGEHNNARLYLSAPHAIVTWLEKCLQVSKLESASDQSWKQTDQDDRVDFLVTWQMPIFFDNIEFNRLNCTSLVGHRINGSDYAQTKFWAKMLLDHDHRFDSCMNDHLQAASYVFRFCTGDLDVTFRNARKVAIATSSGRLNSPIDEALRQVILNDYEEAAKKAAYFGDLVEVADEIASRFNTHFGFSELTGQKLIDKA